MWMKKVVEKVDGTDEEEDAARKAEREAERAREEAERIRKEAEREAEREAEEAEREAEREAARAEREARFEKPQEGELGSFERRPVRPIDEGSPDMAALRALAQPEAPPPARVAPGAAFSRARRDQFPPGLDAALREQGNLDSTIQSSPFGEPTPNLLGTPPRRAQAGRPIQEGAAPVERAPRVPRGVTLMTPEQEQAQLERFGLQNPWAGEPQTPAAPPRTPNVNMEIGEISTTPTARVLEDEIVTTPTPPATPNIVQEQVQLDQQQRQPVLGEFERRPVLPVAEGDMRQRELDRIQQRAAVVSNAATPPPQLPENRTPTSGTTAPMGETPPSGTATPVEAGEGVVSTPASAPTGGSLAPRREMTQDELDEATASLARDPRGRELDHLNQYISQSGVMERTGVLPLDPARGVEFPEGRLGALKDEGFVAPSITENRLSPQSEEPLSAEEEIARAQRRERIFRILRAIGAIGSGIAVGATAASGRNPAFLAPIIRGLGGALGQAQPVEDTRARLQGRQMDERTATQARELDLNALRLAAQERYQQMMMDSRSADRDVRVQAAESLAAYRDAQTEVQRERIEREAGLDDPMSPVSQQIQLETMNIMSLVPEADRLSEEQIRSMSGKRLEALYGQFIRRFGHRGRGTTGTGVGGGVPSARNNPQPILETIPDTALQALRNQGMDDIQAATFWLQLQPAQRGQFILANLPEARSQRVREQAQELAAKTNQVRSVRGLTEEALNLYRQLDRNDRDRFITVISETPILSTVHRSTASVALNRALARFLRLRGAEAQRLSGAAVSNRELENITGAISGISSTFNNPIQVEQALTDLVTELDRSIELFEMPYDDETRIVARGGSPTSVTRRDPPNSDTVRVRSPDGRVGSIPSSRLGDYKQRGYTLVGE